MLFEEFLRIAFGYLVKLATVAFAGVAPLSLVSLRSFLRRFHD
ncbi:MAG TPA: hypothetical protein VEB69_05875 [Acidimicrobiia bacterium]|nr:hypothetical protein [Acidimicrobiia bacterium]